MPDARNSRILIFVLLLLVAAGAGFLLGRAREARPGSAADATSAPAGAPSAEALDAPAASSALARDPAPAPPDEPAPLLPESGARSRNPAASARGSDERAEEEVEATASAAAREPVPDPEPVPVETTVVVPAGTKIRLRLLEGVSSQTAAVGQAVDAEVGAPLAAGGVTAIPAGARVHGRVTEAHALKKVGGRARLALAFDSVVVAGRTVPIEAAFAREGKSETGKDAATIAAGAVVGTVLGNQARHNDRGKVIGGLLGAGVGTAIAASTEGEKIELGPGAELELTLRADVPVRVRR